MAVNEMDEPASCQLGSGVIVPPPDGDIEDITRNCVEYDDDIVIDEFTEPLHPVLQEYLVFVPLSIIES